MENVLHKVVAEKFHLTGTWKGSITYGAEYGAFTGERVRFEMNIDQQENKISGVSFDTEGTGVNPTSAIINGKIKASILVFTKQYKSYHYLSENGVVIQHDRLGLKISYIGYIHPEGKLVSGTWKFKKLFFGLLPFGSQGSGTWEMEKVER